jgi:hypothetical protein
MGSGQVNWRKSSRSFSNGNCVEAASWRKSSRSYGSGNCAEIGHGPGVTGVRDSKLGGASPVLEFSADEWRAFTLRIRDERTPCRNPA